MKGDDPQKSTSRRLLAALLTERGAVIRQSFGDSWPLRIGLTFMIALALCSLWTRGLSHVLATTGFGPHGECLLWLPSLITLYAGSDSLIELAYVSISACLMYLVYLTRRTIPFQWVFVAFGIFIIACGATHFLDTLTLWVPVYWLLGFVKLLTALASVTTALTLPPLLPKVLALIELARVSDERKLQLEQAHRELELLYQKSQDLDRLKTAFFANVSHELRTPLTLILGPTEILLAMHQLTEKQQQTLEVVHRNALTLTKQVNNLLTMAQLEAGQMVLNTTEVDLVQLLQASAAHFEALAQDRHLTLLVDTPASLLAYVDAEKLQRVCLNLLSNAFKFTPPGGRIRCVLSQAGERGMLTIQDSGPGVRPELRQTIFERFRQGEDDQTRHFGGTGLGLAIAKDFVELHKGTITVGDAPEGGACFTIELPLGAPVSTPQVSVLSKISPAEEVLSALRTELSLEADEKTDQEEGHQTTTAEDPQALLLVIEDHRGMAHFLAETLTPAYRVVLAADGQDGLEKALILQPDLILCDLMMPQMGGEQFIKHVRSQQGLDAIPIMILSALADTALRVQFLREGVQEYLVKPFFPEELRARVANLLTMKQVRQVLQQEVTTQNQSLVLLAKEVALRKRENQQTLEALQHANEQLAHASQVQQHCVAMVSHAFRTALTGIRGFSDLMRYQTFSSEECKEDAAAIHAEAERLSHLIADLPDLEQMKSGRMPLTLGRVDLNALIREVVERCRPSAPDQTFALHLEKTLPECMGDRNKLTQVLTHLITNAIKYSPGGGAILLRSQLQQEMAQIWVQDDGRDIPAEAQEEVFDPFSRIEAGTTPPIEGTGLGLSMVRQIVQLHGGQIWVESQFGRGACFCFTIPLADQ